MDKYDKIWENQYLELAVKKLLKEDNTNFQSLIKNIENNSKLKEMVKNLIIYGNKITYNINNPVINLGIIYGVFKNEDFNLKMNNRIYEQLLYDYMSSLIETSRNLSFYNEKSQFINADGSLNVRKILLKFHEFMKHEQSEKRFDIVINYEKRIYILELKIWRGDKYHERGLVQLGEYLEQQI